MALLGWSSLQSAWVAVAPAAAPATANRDVAVAGRRSCVEFYRPVGPRNVVFSIKEFGGDPEEWPVIEPLPSYGRGRERLGGRHISLIHGEGLSDIVITGQNGSIDGQGKMWWDLWWNRTLKHTRGHLLELVNSENILISNLTFLNSPFWTIHPVYCSNVVLKNLTVLAPLRSPNTDGIDPGIFGLSVNPFKGVDTNASCFRPL
ncbi:hypothetical protein OPV22_028121 [Ensete ventricosum]|uniref:Polygalacturonase n=1 Tax=Ensete ventricosum TaxID=4639 RepID=A0AAV8Q283_ENSVE|nr:hypothetical protein OPV22_028121 [Ensete ventricosum]